MITHTVADEVAAHRPLVTLVTGERGAGKSTLCSAIAVRARIENRAVCGVVSIAVFDDSENKVGVDAIELTSHRRYTLARRDGTLIGSRWSCYSFSDDAFTRCVATTLESIDDGAELLILDEIGPLELLAQKGFVPILRHLECARLPRQTYIVVRPTLLDDMIRFFHGCSDRPIIDTVEVTPSNRSQIAQTLGVASG